MILAWDPEERILALVCHACGAVVAFGGESAGPVLWKLMHDLNTSAEGEQERR